jgi:hypothetical protein
MTSALSRRAFIGASVGSALALRVLGGGTMPFATLERRVDRLVA